MADFSTALRSDSAQARDRQACSVRALPVALLLIFSLAVLAQDPSSGVSASAISLPSGPGSVEGLGESFEPQLNSGSYTYGVGIDIPPGRAGLQPSVRVSYDSNAGNSSVGIGWSLPMRSIKRQTDKGFPSYSDADTFVYQGEELVPLDQDGDWRCENESAFQRFRRLDSDQDGTIDAWQVWERSGVKHTFGVHRSGTYQSVVTHPDLPAEVGLFNRTYLWALDSTEDLHGNRIEYDYVPGTALTDSSGILYLSRIRYSLPGPNYHEVRFVYEARTDVFDDYRPTFLVRTGQRLARIEVWSHYDGADHRVRSYTFEYEYRDEDAIELPDTHVDLGVSLLKRVVQYDSTADFSDGAPMPTNFLPPLLFAYSGLDLSVAQVNRVDPEPEIYLGGADGGTFLDLNGDGLPDLYETTSSATVRTQRVLLNRGVCIDPDTGAHQLRFEKPEGFSPSGDALDLTLARTSVNDADADGLVDVVRLETDAVTGVSLEVYANRSDLGRWDATPPGFSSTPSCTSPSGGPSWIANAGVQRMDANFDKISDWAANDESGLDRHFRFAFLVDNSRWEELDAPFRSDMADYDLAFAHSGTPNPKVHLIDMTGDRLADLVYLDAAGGTAGDLTVSYWPFRGLQAVPGWQPWAERVEMQLGDADDLFLDNGTVERVLVQDFTGDGLSDLLIMRDETTIELRVNIAGHSWSAAHILPDMPQYLTGVGGTVFRQADLNGDGDTDLVWRNGGTVSSWEWLDFTLGPKPNLLILTDNNLGKQTTITYGTSTEDMCRAYDADAPWTTKTPTPMQVVRRLRTTCGFDLDGVPDPDGSSFDHHRTSTDQYVVEFQYRDAYYDAFEREFRGYAFAQRIDYGDDFVWSDAVQAMLPSPDWDRGKTPTRQVHAPTLVTRYRFLTGAPDGEDNDEYPDGWVDDRHTDEVTEEGGREEEILKGRQIWEEKIDPWALHDPAGEADFDADCLAAAGGEDRMAPDKYVYQRVRQSWRVRRLYRPEDADLVPPGRFAGTGDDPGVHVAAGNGKSVSFAFPHRVVTEVIEANALLREHLGYPERAVALLEQHADFDDYGNQIETRELGLITDHPAFADSIDDERITYTDFAYGGEALANWIVDRPSRVRVTDENGQFVSENRFYYDGTPFVGRPLGEIGSRGLRHRSQQFITDPATPSPALDAGPTLAVGDPRLDAEVVIDSERSQYDEHGNAIVLLDPLANINDLAVGHVRHIGYDEVFHTYAVSERIVVGDGKPDLATSATYDWRFGTVTAVVDFNNNTSIVGYDSFARPTAIVRPGDSEGLPTQVFQYILADPIRSRLYSYDRDGTLTISPAGTTVAASRVITQAREDAGQSGVHIKVGYVDGDGRELASLAEDETAGRWAITTATSYSRRRGASATWMPFDLAHGTSDADTPAFGILWLAGAPPTNGANGDATVVTRSYVDPLGREIKRENPPETFPVTEDTPVTWTETHILPLELRIYDENDTNRAADNPDRDTPMVEIRDGLERLIAVQQVVRLSDDGQPTAGLNTWTTRYRYGLNDKLAHIIDSQLNEKWMRHDGLGRRIFLNDPDRGTMEYRFDAASNELQSVDAKQQVIRKTYDGVNRLRTEDYLDEGKPVSANRSYDSNQPIGPGNMPDVAYFYDESAGEIDFGDTESGAARNTKGNLAYVIDLAGEEHRSYDTRNRVEWTVKRIPDPFNDVLVSYKTTQEWDNMDRLRGLVYPDNDCVSLAYNARSLLETIPGGPTGHIIRNVDYRPSQQIARCAYGNGITTTRRYDPRLRMDRLHTTPDADTGSPLLSYAYEFDGVSNIGSITDERPASVLADGDEHRNTQVYAYDNLYRLTRYQLSLNAPGSDIRDDGHIDYRCDRIGNMLAKTSSIVHDEDGHSVTNLGDMLYGGQLASATDNGQRTTDNGRFSRHGRSPGDAPGPHALTTYGVDADQTLLYDDNGNVVDLTGMTLVWDFKDRLAAVENDEMRAEYCYDFTDRRVVKKVTSKDTNTPATAVVYINRYFEVRNYDQPVKYIWMGDTRVARIAAEITPEQPLVQRVRLFAGWNQFCLAVEPEARTVAQLLAAGSVFRWDAANGVYGTLLPEDTLAAGDLFWLHTSAHSVLAIRGNYTDRNQLRIELGQYLQTTNPTLVAAAIPEDVAVQEAWLYDGEEQRWRTMLPDLPFLSNAGPYASPGSVPAVSSEAASDWLLPGGEERTLFYHQNHLGSTEVVCSADGKAVEHSPHYPYGYPRLSSARPPPSQSPDYHFTQKERDVESGLQYSEARYYAVASCTWLSHDALALERTLDSPYAYTGLNPVTRSDPTGQIWDTIADVAFIVYDIVDIAVAVVDDERHVSAEQWQALGADIAGALIPFASGGGLALRLGSKADDIGKVGKGIDKAFDAAKTADRAGDASKLGARSADDLVDLTGHRKDHILNRHRAGAGKSAKTEFPKSWSDEKILHEISDVATDPASTRTTGRWGGERATGMRDGVEITVDMYPKNSKHAGKISTGYPTNVRANPR